MKTDHRDPPAARGGRDRLGERGGEVFELIVHRDAQRLEDPGGGVDRAPPSRAPVHPRREERQLLAALVFVNNYK